MKRSLSRCSATGKRRFPDHKSAVNALHMAATVRAWVEAEGERTARQEIRCYRCNGCKGWHLTSWATPESRVRQGAVAQ